MGWFTNVNAEIVCKFCNQKGHVSVVKTTRKGHIDPGKIAGHAAGAFFTAGLSLLFLPATGIREDVPVSEMTCGKCGTTWNVE